jgi:hypothetical protein
MSKHDYDRSRHIEIRDEPFYALIMAAMRKADDVNLLKLRNEWPEIWKELFARYHAPNGLLPGEVDE